VPIRSRLKVKQWGGWRSRFAWKRILLRARLKSHWREIIERVEEIISPPESIARIADAKVSEVVAGENYGYGPSLRCPVCGSIFAHVRGRTRNDADGLHVRVEGECGHNFNIVFESHKGNVFVHVEIAEKDEQEMFRRKALKTKTA